VELLQETFSILVVVNEEEENWNDMFSNVWFCSKF
jgi:hypothetical protein